MVFFDAETRDDVAGGLFFDAETRRRGERRGEEIRRKKSKPEGAEEAENRERARAKGWLWRGNCGRGMTWRVVFFDAETRRRGERRGEEIGRKKSKPEGAEEAENRERARAKGKG